MSRGAYRRRERLELPAEPDRLTPAALNPFLFACPRCKTLLRVALAWSRVSCGHCHAVLAIVREAA